MPAGWARGSSAAVVAVRLLAETSPGRLLGLWSEPGGVASAVQAVLGGKGWASGPVAAGGPAAVLSVSPAACTSPGCSGGVDVTALVRVVGPASAGSVVRALAGGLSSGAAVSALRAASPGCGVLAAGALAASANTTTAGELEPASREPEIGGVIVGVALLCGTLVVGAVVLCYIECTSEKDAFGRGPIEQGVAANCLCLDRSIARLNRGSNGKATSGAASSPPTGREARVPNPLVAAPRQDLAARAAEASRRSRSDRPKSFAETVNPMGDTEGGGDP